MASFGDSGPGDTEALAAEEERRDRTYSTIGIVLLIILIIIVIVIFWRSCAASETGGSSTGGGGIVAEVEQLEAVEGAVAVWVRPGEDIREILDRNGMGGASTVDLGDDTYVVSLPAGDEAAAIDQLKDDPGLYDAGYLYAEEVTASP